MEDYLEYSLDQNATEKMAKWCEEAAAKEIKWARKKVMASALANKKSSQAIAFVCSGKSQEVKVLRDYRGYVSSENSIIESQQEVSELMAAELHTLGGDPKQEVPDELWNNILPYTQAGQ